NDIARLPADVQEHITTLSQMFFIDQGVRIDEMICAYLELPDDKAKQENILRRLHEARLLIGYLYSNPHPSGEIMLHVENSSMFVFQISTMGPDGMTPTFVVWHSYDDHGKRLAQVDEGQQIPPDD